MCPRRLLRNQGPVEERVSRARFKVITSCRVVYVAPWEFAINYELHFAAGNHHAGISRPYAGECCLLLLAAAADRRPAVVMLRHVSKTLGTEIMIQGTGWRRRPCWYPRGERVRCGDPGGKGEGNGRKPTSRRRSIRSSPSLAFPEWQRVLKRKRLVRRQRGVVISRALLSQN